MGDKIVEESLGDNSTTNDELLLGGYSGFEELEDDVPRSRELDFDNLEKLIPE